MRCAVLLAALILASCSRGPPLPGPTTQECQLLPEKEPRCPEDPVATRFCATGAALVYADGREVSMEDIKGWEIQSGPRLCKDGGAPSGRP